MGAVTPLFGKRAVLVAATLTLVLAAATVEAGHRRFHRGGRCGGSHGQVHQYHSSPCDGYQSSCGDAYAYNQCEPVQSWSGGSCGAGGYGMGQAHYSNYGPEQGYSYGGDSYGGQFQGSWQQSGPQHQGYSGYSNQGNTFDSNFYESAPAPPDGNFGGPGQGFDNQGGGGQFNGGQGSETNRARPTRDDPGQNRGSSSLNDNQGSNRNN